ncbi:MAG TPA: hypothetical protein VGA69_07180 [Nitriliruptorales bacterium]
MDRTPVQPTDGTSARNAAQAELPFTASDEDPITFALTARARRQVAPESLPPLEVVPEPVHEPDAEHGFEHGFEDDPTDTRPARARALHRAGLSVQAVATELDVDQVLARAWCGDVAGSARTSRRRVVALEPALREEPVPNPRLTRAWRVYEERRAEARHDIAELLAADVAFARGLGLVTGLAELTPHAAIVGTRDRQIGAAVVRWLQHHAGVDEHRIRVVLQLGPEVAGDSASYEWRRALGLPADRFSVTRWRLAPARDAVQALIRVADPTFAGTLAGWRDALLAATAGPLAG